MSTKVNDDREFALRILRTACNESDNQILVVDFTGDKKSQLNMLLCADAVGASKLVCVTCNEADLLYPDLYGLKQKGAKLVRAPISQSVTDIAQKLDYEGVEPSLTSDVLSLEFQLSVLDAVAVAYGGTVISSRDLHLVSDAHIDPICWPDREELAALGERYNISFE